MTASEPATGVLLLLSYVLLSVGVALLVSLALDRNVLDLVGRRLRRLRNMACQSRNADRVALGGPIRCSGECSPVVEKADRQPGRPTIRRLLQSTLRDPEQVPGTGVGSAQYLSVLAEQDRLDPAVTGEQGMIRIVLIDDHELVRTGFRMILEQQADIEIVGEAPDGELGLALLKKLKPDLALVDVHMPGVSGIEVTERVRKLKLKTRIVIVTMVSESPFPRRLLEAGASGYITKACPSPELLRAVRQVADGRRYLAPGIAEAMALGVVDGSGQSPFESLVDAGTRSRPAARAWAADAADCGTAQPQQQDRGHLQVPFVRETRDRQSGHSGAHGGFAWPARCQRNPLTATVATRLQRWRDGKRSRA